MDSGGEEEFEEALRAYASQNEVKYSLANLHKAARTIRKWVEEDARGKSFEIELPEFVNRQVRREMGRDFDSHNITANGIAHALKNHGENGLKLTENNIPIRKDDMELIPYIMVAPDSVVKAATDASGRESVRFYKKLEKGYAVVVEKEYKNSPDDMETITMWAEMSPQATNAQLKTAPDTHVLNAIPSTDIAKIIKDAENAITKEQKNAKNLYSLRELDAPYLDAVERGDMEAAQRMVLEVERHCSTKYNTQYKT